MTGVEVAAAAAAAGTAATATAATAATAAAATAITAAEAAALGLSAAEAAAAASAGLSAAEVAAATAATGATETAAAAGAAEAASATAATEGGLLNGAGHLAPEMGTAAPETTGLLAEQAPAELVDRSTQAGWYDKLNYQTNGNLGATKEWLGQKPFGNGSFSPSRGKLLAQGGQIAMGGGQQQPAPQARPVGGQLHPSAQSSPYAPQQMNGTATPQQFLSMADFLRQRGY